MRELVLIAHDIRSTHNVGSLLRTADGLGVRQVFLTGYTPYPLGNPDDRLPHLAAKIDRQITKTALGAQQSVKWEHTADVRAVIEALKQRGYTVIALEQSPSATSLHDFQPPGKVVILLGREVEGIDPAVLALCDKTIEIPMLGAKESFNVAQAAAMALYHMRFML